MCSYHVESYDNNAFDILYTYHQVFLIGGCYGFVDAMDTDFHMFDGLVFKCLFILNK
jgi:hypothetical protein